MEGGKRAQEHPGDGGGTYLSDVVAFRNPVAQTQCVVSARISSLHGITTTLIKARHASNPATSCSHLHLRFQNPETAPHPQNTHPSRGRDGQI